MLSLTYESHDRITRTYIRVLRLLTLSSVLPERP